MAGIYEDLETSLYTAVQTALPVGFTTIFGYENGPEPPFPFLQIDVISMDAIGRDYSGFLVCPTDSSTHYEQTYEAIVRFYFFGHNDSGRTIADIATEFEFSLNKQSVQEAFEANKIGLMRKSGLLRSPKKYDTKWVMCYQMDCTFSYTVSDKQTINWVEEVHITGNYLENEWNNTFSGAGTFNGEGNYNSESELAVSISNDIVVGESTVVLP